MTLTIELAPETEAALTEKARRRGLALDAYLLDLALRDEPGEPGNTAPKITAASVRGKYAVPGGATVDEFMAERRAEGLAEMRAEEAAFQATQAAGAQVTQRRAA